MVAALFASPLLAPAVARKALLVRRGTFTTRPARIAANAMATKLSQVRTPSMRSSREGMPLGMPSAQTVVCRLQRGGLQRVNLGTNARVLSRA